MIKTKLVILSDLHGLEKSNWVKNYVEVLDKKFIVKCYDCCELGEINLVEVTEENIHKHFLNGGIEKAVENLMLFENKEVYILAFSIGGLIGWKAGLLGLKVKSMLAISSTRLRNEIEKPNFNIELYFGKLDEFKPKNYWFENFEIKEQLIDEEKHDFYKKAEITTKMTKLILEKFI